MVGIGHKVHFDIEISESEKLTHALETRFLKTRTKALVDSLCFSHKKTAPAARHTGVVYFAFNSTFSI